MVPLLWKTAWRFLKKFKTELPYGAAVLLLSIRRREMKEGTQKDICTSKFMAALFTVAKRWKQPRCPSVDDGQRNCVRTYIGVLSSLKKEGDPDTCDNMDEP